MQVTSQSASYSFFPSSTCIVVTVFCFSSSIRRCRCFDTSIHISSCIFFSHFLGDAVLCKWNYRTYNDYSRTEKLHSKRMEYNTFKFCEMAMVSRPKMNEHRARIIICLVRVCISKEGHRMGSSRLGIIWMMIFSTVNFPQFFTKNANWFSAKTQLLVHSTTMDFCWKIIIRWN